MAAISLRTLGVSFEEAVRWAPLADGSLPSVSVNLSVTQLLADDLLEIVASDLERSGLDPARVTVELTEHVLGADEHLVARRLSDLRRLGISLALDDFGTGWSSLRLVRTMPFDLIKIDRTFTADVDQSPEGAEFAGRIVALARSMGRKVVAEGIEREAQLEVMSVDGLPLRAGLAVRRSRAARALRPAPSGPRPRGLSTRSTGRLSRRGRRPWPARWRVPLPEPPRPDRPGST